MTLRWPPRLGPALWWTLALVLGLPAAWAFSQHGPLPLQSPPETWPALASNWVLRPDAGLAQPLHTWWTAAWLHASAQHLWRNLLALGLLSALASALQVRARAALAWLLAWPLTQWGMIWQPTPIDSYVGLSGVLHAGAAILAVSCLFPPRSFLAQSTRGNARRWLGLALLMGLLAKITMENPWQHPLIVSPGSDITMAPWAHFTGASAGLLMALSSSVTDLFRFKAGATPPPPKLG